MKIEDIYKNRGDRAQAIAVLRRTMNEASSPTVRNAAAYMLAEALNEAICRLLEDDEAAKGLAARARAWVERELDVEVSLDAYTRLYAALAHS